MRHQTYKLLRQAYLGDVNKTALFQIQDPDPFVQHTIRLTTTETNFPSIPWDALPFTDHFQSASSRERLDQTVVTFLLRVVAIVKEELYKRTFIKPESWSAMLAWVSLLKECLFSVLTLLYDVTWNAQRFSDLDAAVLDLMHRGNPSTLRRLMESLGIRLSRDTPFEAELAFETLGFLSANQFGSFFWRLLHWMAEAVESRDATHTDVAWAKATWRRFVLGPMYRLLRCGICMAHLQKMVQDQKEKLMDETVNYPLLWFHIHNQVTTKKFQRLPLYSEEEFQRDAAFMRQALPSK